MNIERLLAVQLTNYINDNITAIGLPKYITLGAPVSLSGEALWLQLLGSSTIKQYLRGGKKGTFDFAIYYRMSASQTDGYEAKLLVPHEQLSDHFDELTEMPKFKDYTITNIEMTKSPTIFRKSEDGEITYQSLWRMDYQTKKKEGE